MKRTSDRLATFINKKLTQAATAFDPQPQSAPPCPHAPPSPCADPQQGQPLYNTTSTDYNLSSTEYTTPAAPVPPPPAPPVTNAALASPYPPSEVFPAQGKPHGLHTPMSTSVQSSVSSYTAPSPYTLPPSTHTPQMATPEHSIPTHLQSSVPPLHGQSYFRDKPNISDTSLLSLHPPQPLYHSHEMPPHPPIFTPAPPQALQPAQLPDLKAMLHRAAQARSAFPHAELPLSRALDPSNEADLELWRYQLTHSYAVAVVPTRARDLPEGSIFTLSTTPASTTSPPLTPVLWARLKRVLTHLSAHHKPVYLVLPPPAHTRLLAPAAFPVISLSPLAGALSRDAGSQPWAFLEEVSGAWGGGVVYACETRGASVTGVRELIRSVHRRPLELVECMRHALRNVYFGAVEADDEIADMAKWAFTKGVAVGETWREAVLHGSGGGLLPGRGVWLDGSRTVDGDWAGGIGREFVRGCVRVVTVGHVYYLVRFGEGEGVWVLVGDVGKRVWSKIVCGEGAGELDGGGFEIAVGKVLSGLVGRVEVVSVGRCDVRELG